MLSIILFGLLIGMQHALEADHVAAVSSLVSRQTSRRGIIRHGAVWGLGHALTLMVVAGGAILLGLTLSEGLAHALEALVGMMLIGLGGQVVWRLIRDKVHFHKHRHEDATVHLHAHSHAGDDVRGHGFDHRHAHPAGLPIRTLLVGMTHGLAGSAALVILGASSASEPWAGFIYVCLFGLGSVLGMAVLSAVIAVPLAFTARFLTIANRVLQGGIGVLTCGLGVFVLVTSVY